MNDPLSEVARDAARVLGLLDLTELSDDCRPDAIDVLCAKATGPRGSVPAVCIWPRFVAQAGGLLAGTGVRIAAVVNFPSGMQTVEATLGETETALHDGADEIDLVLPWRAFLDGDTDHPGDTVRSVRRVMGAAPVLKVILETGNYPDQDAVARAARLAVAEGADFLKTSTGKTAVSASLPAAKTLLGVIRSAERSVGIKPSGGIRTLEQARGFLALADDIMGPTWATAHTFRFGASALHAVLLDALAT